MLYGPDNQPLTRAEARILGPDGTPIYIERAEETAAIKQPELAPPVRIEMVTPLDRVEVTRSFSYKLNLANHGGPQYESVDFFCSEKVHCAANEAEDASLAAYSFCRAEVLKSVEETKAKLGLMAAKRQTGRAA